MDVLASQDIATRVTGSAPGVADLVADGMLHGRILVSPHAHALIRAIDTSNARALPGVFAVLTHVDCAAPAVRPHVGSHREAPLLTGEARFAGDWIAAVAAETGLIADEAMGLIDVDYALLPAVLEPSQASDPGAPLVHGDVPGNRAEDLPYPLPSGDMKAAFADAARSVELSGIASRQTRLDFGQQAAFAAVGADGLVTVTCASPVSAHEKTSGRSLEALAALLAQTCLRPVKLVEPDLGDAFSRHSSSSHSVRIAADNAGAIVALDHVVVVNAGAYSAAETGHAKNAAPVGALRVGSLGGGVSIVYTHRPPAGDAGITADPHSGFIVQQAIDMLAATLDIDPLAFRLRNLVPGDAGARMEACLRAGADRFGWHDKWRGWTRDRGAGGRYRQGVGLSILSRHHAGQAFGHQADFVEVEVDTETGFAVLLSHVCALDVTDLRGLPDPVHLQASVVRSIGNALIDDVAFDGRPGSMSGTVAGPLRAPTIMDAPDADYVFTGTPLGEGAGGHDPAGAGLADLTPAMANAIFDAAGIRMNTLPFSADKILRSLRSQIRDTM